MESGESSFTVHPKDWQEFQHQLSTETDRSAALMGVAFLDSLLGALIEQFMLPLSVR